MKRFTDLVAEAIEEIEELFPWELDDALGQEERPVLLDIREPAEFSAMRIEGSINVPRGVLEGACDWGYDDTVPELVQARDRQVVVVCRSGSRSALAALTMKRMGYQHAVSLKTGLRGWNDFEQPLVDAEGNAVDLDDADVFFAPRVSPEQEGP